MPNLLSAIKTAMDKKPGTSLWWFVNDKLKMGETFYPYEEIERFKDLPPVCRTQETKAEWEIFIDGKVWNKQKKRWEEKTPIVNGNYPNS
jgi:hypothetical protein